MSEHERRRRGVSFHTDEDNTHWTTAVFKTYQVGVAFLIQLGALAALLWGMMQLQITPLIDNRIEYKVAPMAQELKMNTEYIIRHRGEVEQGLLRMQDFEKKTNQDRAEIMSRLDYLTTRIDAIYERTRR